MCVTRRQTATEKRIGERARAVVENCIERRSGDASKTCPHICLTSNLEVLQRNTFVFFQQLFLFFSLFFSLLCFNLRNTIAAFRINFNLQRESFARRQTLIN